MKQACKIPDYCLYVYSVITRIKADDMIELLLCIIHSSALSFH